jgi:hypothetical protein
MMESVIPMMHPRHGMASRDKGCSAEALSTTEFVGTADGVLVLAGDAVAVGSLGVMVGNVPHEQAAHSLFGYSTQFTGLSISV